MQVLTTALMQAFMPGESPPEVKTAIFFIRFKNNKKSRFDKEAALEI